MAISKLWATKIAETQDFGGKTKDNFVRILNEAPDDRSIDPISDIIINAVLDADGDDYEDMVDSMVTDLNYAISSLTRARNAIIILNCDSI